MLCFIIILLTLGEHHRDARIYNTAFVDLTLAKNMRHPEVKKNHEVISYIFRPIFVRMIQILRYAKLRLIRRIHLQISHSIWKPRNTHRRPQ